MSGKLTVNAYRVIKRGKSPVNTWVSWKQILADEQDIQVIFDFDADVILFKQKETFELKIKGLDAYKDSFRGSYLQMRCRDKNDKICTVLLYGAVKPLRDYKRIFIKYEDIQISYHYT